MSLYLVVNRGRNRDEPTKFFTDLALFDEVTEGRIVRDKSHEPRLFQIGWVEEYDPSKDERVPPDPRTVVA